MGSRVQIQDVIKHQELNGCEAEIISVETGKFQVRIDRDRDGRAKAKPQNATGLRARHLRLLCPPPEPAAPPATAPAPAAAERDVVPSPRPPLQPAAVPAPTADETPPGEGAPARPLAQLSPQQQEEKRLVQLLPPSLF